MEIILIKYYNHYQNLKEQQMNFERKGNRKIELNPFHLTLPSFDGEEAKRKTLEGETKAAGG
jgi:hypothetical protein